MSQITCPACDGYLGLAAAGATACPKCGASLALCAESGGTVQKKRIPGGMLGNAANALMGLATGAAVLALIIGTAIVLVPRFIDAAIPGGIGLWCAIWPRSLFYFEREAPDEAKIAKIRSIGIVLLFVAALCVVIKLLGG